jgi:hypothetical protein
MRGLRRAVVAAVFMSVVCTGLGSTAVAATTPQAADLMNQRAGHAGKCHHGKGVTVVVNFKAFKGKIVIRCAPGHPDNGIQALRQAGYAVKGTKETGLAFVCRINRKPSPRRQKCIHVPPPNAYWAYYHAKRGAKKWSYSSTGPLSYHPPQGSIEAWAWGDGRKPGISPPEVRHSRLTPSPRPSGSLSARRDPVVTAARAYLVGQLRTRPTMDYLGYDDFGLLADVVIALDSAGLHPARAIARLASGYSTYVGSGSHVSAGALAKLLVVAGLEGRSPHSFGGHDLVRVLASLLDRAGRYVDQPASGDLSNTFSQSLAVMGLAQAGLKVPNEALQFLIRQQCGSGPAGFRLLMATSVCTNPGQADVDSTSMAVRALLMAGRSHSAARALTWLERQQSATGGLAGSPPTDVVNANSTGLALAAFATGRRTEAASRAASYLQGLQLRCSAPASVRGAVSYSQRHHRRDVRHPHPNQELTRATAQALVGLAAVNHEVRAMRFASCGTERPSPSAPTGAVSSATAPSSDTANILVVVVLLVVGGGTLGVLWLRSSMGSHG